MEPKYYKIRREVVEELLNVLSNHWFTGPYGEYNNDDIVSIEEKIRKEIAANKDSDG